MPPVFENSVYDLKAVFFDDRVGEHFLGNVLELFLRFVAAPAIEIQDEEFALADVTHGGVAEPREGVLDRLSLGIEHRAFWHNPDMSFHAESITSATAKSAGALCDMGQKCVLEAHFNDTGQLVFPQSHARCVRIFLA